MTIHQLRLFVAIAERGNITAASYDVHISQPAVSRQIKLLEEECGYKLYTTNSRGIELTPAGKRFLERARILLLEFDRLKTLNAAAISGKNEILSIGGSHTPSASFLPSLIANFRKTYPKVHIVVRTASCENIERMVVDSEIDIGFMNLPYHSPLLAYEPLYEHQLVAICSKKHPLAQKRYLNIDAIAATPLIVKTGMTSCAEFVRYLDQYGASLNVILECDDPQVIVAAVKTGVGLGILYRDVIENEIRAGGLKILRINKLDIKGRTFVAYKKDRKSSGPAGAFLDAIRKSLEEIGEDGYFPLRQI
jgi:DNA-binding transcriptional LysR family regulator